MPAQKKKAKSTPAKNANAVNPLEGITVTVDELIKLRHAAENLGLESLLKVKTLLAGNQTSTLRGRGIDFAEVRIYQPGDDIRHMDWKVTARSGKPHTKLFQEERERPIFIVIDYCPSMFFGTKKCFKSVVAAKIAATLAWAAVKHNDRVGGLIFSGQQTVELRPQAGMRGALQLMQKLANTAEPYTAHIEPGALANALGRLRRIVRPGSLLMILSDFMSLDTTAERHLSQLARQNDILAGFIFDPLEVTPPPADLYAVSDGEEIISLDTSMLQLCKNYRANFIDRFERVKYVLRQRHIPLLTIATNHDLAQRLLSYLGNIKGKQHRHFEHGRSFTAIA